MPTHRRQPPRPRPSRTGPSPYPEEDPAALPDGLPTVTITDQRTHPDCGPMRGRIVLTPAVPTVAAEQGTIIMGPAEATWDDTGALDLTVLACDADGITPTGTLTMQWAQNVSWVTPTVLRAGSWLRVTRTA